MARKFLVCVASLALHISVDVYYFIKRTDLAVTNERWEEMQLRLQSRTQRAVPVTELDHIPAKWSGSEDDLVTDYRMVGGTTELSFVPVISTVMLCYSFDNGVLFMKYDYKEIEKRWKKEWSENQTYTFTYDENKPTYTVDTPPPYVSADHLHVGHIMSYTQAEFIVRYKRMRGYNVFYPMGFDDNGLPTERFVEKKYKVDKSKICRSDFIKLCLKETQIGSETYKQLWTDLGISVDWSKTYSTISPVAMKTSQWSLIDLYNKNLLYRAEKPILWCTTCKTALAQADLEETEVDSKMNYISFGSHEGKNLVIATTRPELLPACVALYVNPNDSRYSNLIDQKVKVPLFDYEVPVKASTAVDQELGTGLMIVCTWGDQEDLEKWQEDELDTRTLVTEDGLLNELGREFAGLTLLEARKAILSQLDTNGLLLKQEDINHTVKVHERCDTPIEFVQSKQWFIKIADNKKLWLEYGEKLNWFPPDRKSDYDLWVKSLKWDWCVSRQRYYGVPLPIWYCSDCDKPIFAKEENLPVNPTEDTPPVTKCEACGGENITPEQGVMDTWATSSCTPFMLRELVEQNKTKEQLFPVSLRPNAFEIIRTWDFYSIVKSVYHFDCLPFQDVMISGHGLDEYGRKLAKRLGNYIPSQELLDTYGADAIRYWATGAMLGKNLKFNISEVDKGKKTAVKLWNVANLLQLSGVEGTESIKVDEHLEYADIWILDELNETIRNVTRYFDEYAYAKAKNELDTFFWSKFTDYYLEFVKYRLREEDEQSKKVAQSLLSYTFLSILKMYAPILPFITEELFHKLYSQDTAQSIHASDWVTELNIDTVVKNAQDFSNAIEAIDEVRKYKSEQGMPLGTELSSYKLTTQVDTDKYGDFLKKAIRVKELV